MYKQSEIVATAVNVEPTTPRTCARQKNRLNAEAETVEEWYKTVEEWYKTVEEWYKVNFAVSFLDHIIAQLDSQFSALAQTSQLLGLVPSVICSKSRKELFDQEFTRRHRGKTCIYKDLLRRDQPLVKVLYNSMTVISFQTSVFWYGYCAHFK